MSLREYQQPGLIFLLALGIRILFVIEWMGLPYGHIPFLDANSYDQWAQSIAGGAWLRHTAFYQNPLYPYVLGSLYKAFGPSLAMVSYLQAAIGALTCAIVARTSEVVFGKRTGLFAGLLMTFDGVLIFYVAPVIKETLGIFLLAWFVHLIFTRDLEEDRWSGFLAGILLGAAVLVRSNLLILPLGFLLWDFLSKRRFFLRKYKLLCAGAAIAIMPATVHNWIAADDFVPVVYGGGFNFYIGNSPAATNLVYPTGVSTDPVQEEKDTTRIAESELHRSLKPSEVSSYWFGKAIQFLEGEPLAFPSLLVKKIWFFWMNPEIPDGYDGGFVARNFSTSLKFGFVSFTLLAFLAAIGTFLGWNTPPSDDKTRGMVSFVLIYMISVVPFYVTDRYRMPVILFLVPLAAHGTRLLVEGVRQADWKPIIKAFAFSVPLLIVGCYPVQWGPNFYAVKAFNWGVFASLSSDAGSDLDAVAAMEKALAINPIKINSSTYIKASTSYERLGRLAEAEDMLRKATAIYPDEGLIYFNYGRFKFEHDDLKSALELYRRAAAVSPLLHQPYIGLAILFMKQGDRADALESVKKGLSLSPDNQQLQQLLKMLGG
jgi:4-amino-4-deoxy-L-arabinose transferase-like glycosyltransferase